MRLIARSFLVVAIAAIALPASAIKIVPGTYKLTWDERREFADPLWGKHSSIWGSLSVLSDEGWKLTGTASKRAIGGRTREPNCYPVVLDESKGTGKGYDTLYIGQPNIYMDSYDVGQMTRIPLTRRGRDLVADGYLARVPTDPWSGKLGAKRRFDVKVEFNRADGADKPSQVFIFIRGAWYGTVKTDKGPVRARLDDSFDLQTWSTLILDTPDACARNIQLEDFKCLSVGVPEVFDNRLYLLSFNPTTGKLTVGPYKGPVGTLIVDPKDGFGKPLTRGMLWLTNSGSAGNYYTLKFYISGKQSLQVPANTYSTVMATFYAGPRNDYVFVHLRKPELKVLRGKTSTLMLGGPITLKMEVQKDNGGRRQIVCKPIAPNALETDISGIDLKLDLKDSSGRVVQSQRKNRRDFDVWLGFDIPPSLKPGSYAALLTVDLQPYDRKKVFGAKLRIE